MAPRAPDAGGVTTASHNAQQQQTTKALHGGKSSKSTSATVASADTITTSARNTTTQPLRDITWEELWNEHNGSTSDPWICIDGIVYAISDQWMQNHPGGQDMLLLFAGRDATHAFESYHMLETASKMLQGIAKSNSSSGMLTVKGRLSTHQFPTYDVSSSEGANGSQKQDQQDSTKRSSMFYATLKKRVVDHFRAETAAERLSMYHDASAASVSSRSRDALASVRDKDINFRSITTYTLCNTVFILGSLALCYYVSMYANFDSLLLQALFALLAGLFHHLSMVHLFHDMSHYAYSRNPLVWRFFGQCADWLTGHSVYVWKHRHCVGHHVYTNVSGVDPDLGIYKASPKTPILPYRAKVQIVPTWFQPILYTLVVQQMQMDDLFSYWRRSMEQIKMSPQSLYDRTQFYGAKILYLLHRVVLPIWLGTRSPMTALFLYSITHGTAGVLFGVFSQITHITEEAEWPAATLITEDWAEMQVKTATDYAHDSAFWTYMAGYLNYQVVHHLLPSIGPHNYPALLPIVKQTCNDFDVPYTILPGFWQALGAHLNHLTQFEKYRERFRQRVRDGEIRVDAKLVYIMVRNFLGITGSDEVTVVKNAKQE